MVRKSVEILYAIFLSLPWGTPIVWMFVAGGSYKVLKLGRSKNGYKKLKQSLTFRDRLFKIRFVELSKRAKGYQKYFCFMTYLGYALALILLALWITSMFVGDFEVMFKWYVYIKGYLFELPALVFTIFNIGRPKSGIGLDWRFIEE